MDATHLMAIGGTADGKPLADVEIVTVTHDSATR
jgi:hypothetical protein